MRLGKLDGERYGFAAMLSELKKLEANKRELIIARNYVQQLDLLRFQVQEIQNAKLQPREEQEDRAGNIEGRATPPTVAAFAECNRRLIGKRNLVLNQARMVGRSLADLHDWMQAGSKTHRLPRASVGVIGGVASRIGELFRSRECRASAVATIGGTDWI